MLDSYFMGVWAQPLQDVQLLSLPAQEAFHLVLMLVLLIGWFEIGFWQTYSDKIHKKRVQESNILAPEGKKSEPFRNNSTPAKKVPHGQTARWLIESSIVYY